MRPQIVLGSLLLSILGTANTALASFGMPDPVSPRMETIDDIYSKIFIAGIFVFVFVMVWLLVVLLRYRAGSGKGRRTNEEHRENLQAELAWTIIPLFIVLWVGWISYQGLVVLDEEPPSEPVADVELTGFQWFWKATYTDADGNEISYNANQAPDGGLENANPFVIPADEVVTLTVNSGDVIHAMWIPELGVKLDANPHKDNEVWVQAPEGEYYAQCAENCGFAGHYAMRALFKAVPMDEYETWLAEKSREVRSNGRLVTATDTGLEVSDFTEATGAPFDVLVANTASQTVTVSVDGTDATTGPLAPGEETFLEVLVDEPGEFTFTSEVGTGTFNVVEPTDVTIELDDFAIISEEGEGRVTFEAGQAYRINVVNVGNTGHNLYFGDLDSRSAIAQSVDIGPGEETSFIVRFDEAGEIDMWCNIPGHVDLGMFGTAVIS